MAGPLPDRLALVLVGLLIATPSQSIAQRHGARAHGGWSQGWSHGGGGYGYRPAYAGGYRGWSGVGYPAYGYRGYGYPYGSGYVGHGGYYGYPGYYDYHHHHHDNDVWIAVGAGILGVVIGSVISRPRAYGYGYPPQAYSPPPATQQCPDGSTIPAGSYCPEPPAPAPQPAPAPPPQTPERG